MHRAIVAVLAASTLWSAPAARAADITVRQIAELLFKAAPGAGPDLTGRDLSGLDLAGLDFKGARLDRANMMGVDLTGANLAGADLEGATLDRAVLQKTNLDGARLKGAQMRSLSVFSGLDPDRREAPSFVGADLEGARIEARLDGTNFRNANLTRATLAAQTAIWGSYKPRTVLNGADFAGARMVEADLERAVLQFARFNGADLTRANLRRTDLSRADLTGANLTGADLTGADLDGTNLAGVTGLASVVGLDTAGHLDSVRR